MLVFPLVSACAGPSAPTAGGQGELRDGAWGTAQKIADAGQVPLSNCGLKDPPCLRYYDERYFPALAMNERGEAVAAWHRDEGGFRLYGARFDPAAGWGREERVTDSVGSHDHRVSLDADGTAAATWIWYVPDHDRGTPRGRDGSAASVAPRGGAWTAERPLGAAYDRVRALDVGADGNGVALLARECKFYDPACTWGDVLVARLRGGEWLGHESVRRKPASPCEEISVLDRAAAVAPRGGGAVAVWMEYDRGPTTATCPEGAQRLLSSRFEDGWTAPVLLDRTDDRLGTLDVRSVAMDAHGGAMVAYVKSPRFDDRRVSAQRYVPGRGWQPPQVLGTDGRDPKVALDRDGNALVLWSGGDRRLHGRWFRVREEVWEPEQVLPGSEDVAGMGFAIAGGPTGHALAVWSRWTPSGDDDSAFAAVMASRFTAGGRWTDAVSIQGPSSRAADGWPSLAVDAGGNAIAVWAETDGTSVSIWANRFQVR